MTNEQRQAIERKIVRHLIRTAKKHGYSLRRIWDGETNEHPATEAGAIQVVFSVDDCKMYFKHPDEGSAHVAVIILGNDGYDCIADCSEGGLWDAVMGEMNDYADKFDV